MKHILASTLSFFLLTIPIFAQPPGRILIIGIDGCRSDALRTADAPNIHGLLDHAVYSYDALTRFPTSSGPCWSSMCTGVWWEKHGVTDNTFIGSNYDQYPHFIHRTELMDPDRRTVSICHWSPINTELNTLCDVELNVNSDLEVKNSAVTYLNADDPDILFLDFDDVDHAGHTYGFSPTVPEYIASINLTDQYVGEILDALQARPDFENENWMVILTPDHGGTLSGHGGTSFEERNIFFIAWKPEMDPLEIKFDTTQTSLTNGLDFNGINQYLLPDDSSPFSVGTTHDFSVELRVRYVDLPGDASFISNKDWGNGTNPGWVLSTPFSDDSHWKVNIGDGTNRADVEGGSINDGQWHHLTVTFDRDGMMALYEDGTPIGETSMAHIGNMDTPFPTVIGQDGTFEYPFFFQGSIAEVRIWKTILDPQTIAAYTCSSIDDLHPDIESLISYWKMDEGFGDKIFNSIADAPSATMQGDSAIWTKQPGPLTCYDYAETPKIVDVAVTALTHLCIPIDSAWHLDGRSWVTDCNLVSTNESKIQDDDIRILPNPANDQLSIEIINGSNEKNQILSMFDSKGTKVLTAKLYDDTAQLDVSMLPAGLYIISVVSSTNLLMTTCIIL